MVQTYQNPFDKFMEVDYAFPICPEASIYRFVAKFGNVTIEGVVKEKEEAEREYAKAKQEGRLRWVPSTPTAGTS